MPVSSNRARKRKDRRYEVLRATVVLYLENLASQREGRLTRFEEEGFTGLLTAPERALYEAANEKDV